MEVDSDSDVRRSSSEPTGLSAADTLNQAGEQMFGEENEADTPELLVRANDIYDELPEGTRLLIQGRRERGQALMRRAHDLNHVDYTPGDGHLSGRINEQVSILTSATEGLGHDIEMILTTSAGIAEKLLREAYAQGLQIFENAMKAISEFFGAHKKAFKIAGLATAVAAGVAIGIATYGALPAAAAASIASAETAAISWAEAPTVLKGAGEIVAGVGALAALYLTRQKWLHIPAGLALRGANIADNVRRAGGISPLSVDEHRDYLEEQGVISHVERLATTPASSEQTGRWGRVYRGVLASCAPIVARHKSAVEARKQLAAVRRGTRVSVVEENDDDTGSYTFPMVD